MRYFFFCRVVYSIFKIRSVASSTRLYFTVFLDICTAVYVGKAPEATVYMICNPVTVRAFAFSFAKVHLKKEGGKGVRRVCVWRSRSLLTFLKVDPRCWGKMEQLVDALADNFQPCDPVLVWSAFAIASCFKRLGCCLVCCWSERPPSQSGYYILNEIKWICTEETIQITLPLNPRVVLTQLRFSR